MLVDVVNNENNKVDTVELPEGMFKVKWNPDLVKQVLMVQLANERQVLAHTKGRGEVRGGGKKPWRQKGTGRSRQGSIRSPLWKGGGVSFGPKKERNFTKQINKKMRQLALRSVLSKKLKDDELAIIDNLKPGEEKAKKFAPIMHKISGKKLNALVIPSSENKIVGRIGSNIKGIGFISPLSLNVRDLLKYKKVILEKSAIEEITKHYSK